MHDRFFEVFGDAIDRAEANPVSMSGLPDAGAAATDRVAAKFTMRSGIAQLRCPEPRLRYVSRAGWARGQTEQLPDGSCVVTLNLAEIKRTDELAAVLYHELKHVDQFHRGEFSRLSRVQRERDAMEFSDQMMRQEGDRLNAAIATAAFRGYGDTDTADKGGLPEASIFRRRHAADEPGGLVASSGRTPYERLGAFGESQGIPASSQLVSLDAVRTRLAQVMADLRRSRRRAVDQEIPRLVTRESERSEVQRYISASFVRAEREIEGFLITLREGGGG